jgi:ABC-type polar amino acid transport system ATPase subunit
MEAPMADDPMIALDQVCKSYGATAVLRGCTTAIGRGEVVVICGPSGSGKSTLLKCINGLEPYQSGSIRVDGVEVGARTTTCRSCAPGSAWCSSTSNSIRTCRRSTISCWRRCMR